MELSAKTEAFLANFAKINQNMLFLEGNTIKTMSEARNVLASANIEENIPKEFGIYDLNEFLRVIALVNPKPSLKFEDDNILFRDSSGRMKVKYFYSSKESLTYPNKDIVMPEPDVSFILEDSTLLIASSHPSMKSSSSQVYI